MCHFSKAHNSEGSSVRTRPINPPPLHPQPFTGTQCTLVLLAYFWGKEFLVAAIYFCVGFNAAKMWRRDDVGGGCDINSKERIALKSNFIEISFTGVKGSPKSQTLQRSRCLRRTYWVSADIFPYELEAKCWVYLWKQTGPYISLGITEISCINTGSFCCSQEPPSSAFVQTWGKAIVIHPPNQPAGHLIHL